jgi:hypothetical protein
LEAAGGDEKKNGAHGVKRQAIEPEMRESRAAQDDAAGDVDATRRGEGKLRAKKEHPGESRGVRTGVCGT